MGNLLGRCWRLANLASLPLGLLILGVPNLTARGELDPGRWNQFDVCVTEMKNNGVDAGKAAEACSNALIPKELSSCVRKIQQGTPIEGEKALTACFQVRRPIDLANCVVDIQRAVLKSKSTPTPSEEENEGEEVISDSERALDSCRASLLPGRHSECVIALSRDVEDMTPMQAMNTCLSAENFPPDLFPAYTNN